MESHWHWMPEDFFFFLITPARLVVLEIYKTRYNEVEMQNLEI